MILTNKLGLPESVVRAVARDPYSKGDADFSATELLKPPQIARLQREHDHEIEEDVSDRVWSLLGNGVHNILENAYDGDDVITEQRLFGDIEVHELGREPKTYTVSGALDLQNLGGVGTKLYDYKVTSVYSVQKGGSEDWEKQVNIYDWLAWKNNINLTEREIVVFMRDWKKSQAARKRDYPVAPMQVFPINRWTHEEQEKFIRARIVLHTTDPAPECSREETWGGIRCKDWCPAAPFCPQFNGGR